MNKVLKLIFSAFIGLDIFVFGYLGLAQLRFALFGTGAITGGGSAMDMALFLIPLFLGYLCGDRLFYFLTYRERQAKKLLEINQKPSQNSVSSPVDLWQDREWQEQPSAPSPAATTSKRVVRKRPE